MSKIRLETVAHTSLILVSLMAGYSLIEERIAAHPKPKRPPVENLVGKKINLPGPWEQNPINVIIAISSTCRFCVASVPFYRRLDTLAHESSSTGRISLTFVSPEPIETIRRFLSDQGITADRVSAKPLASLGITATPTLLVVDSQGVVRRAIAGKLKSLQEETTVKTLKEGI